MADGFIFGIRKNANSRREQEIIGVCHNFNGQLMSSYYGGSFANIEEVREFVDDCSEIFLSFAGDEKNVDKKVFIEKFMGKPTWLMQKDIMRSKGLLVDDAEAYMALQRAGENVKGKGWVDNQGNLFVVLTL